MRLFLAINLEAAVRAAVAVAAAPLREAAPELSWVEAHRLHLTLKFLGEQSNETAHAVGSAMDAVARRHGAMRLFVRQFGAFPNFRRPRVVWIGMDDDPRLEMLHHDVETAGAALGLALEGKPFRPHVTLARVRERPSVDTLRALAGAARRESRQRFAITIQSIDLMRSTLRPNGTLHERLHSSPLRES